MQKKRITATLYLDSKIKFLKQGLTAEHSPEGYLFSDGQYATKILPTDLPEWFVYGYLCKRHGYISAKGAKHLRYVPNYSFDNHLHKDDILFVSYGEEIEEIQEDGRFAWYKGYKHLVSGSLIESFVEAAQKYSGYDVEEIQEEIARKQAWYYDQNPNECR